MRSSRARALLVCGALALLPALLAACGPLAEPEVGAEEERPCHTDADCEVHSAESETRRALCTSPTMGSHGAQNDITGKEGAACGPMPNMTPRLPEPELLCFRGTCVPVGSKR